MKQENKENVPMKDKKEYEKTMKVINVYLQSIQDKPIHALSICERFQL